MSFPSQTFSNITNWENWVNIKIIPNGLRLITGNIGNITENAAIKFIRQSPLNWEKAKIESSGGDIVASRPIMLFSTITPDSLSWGDNIYNQYIFINSTSDNIPLADGYVYYDINLVEIAFIPSKTAVTIIKSCNDLWIAIDVSQTPEIPITQTEGLLTIGETYKITDYNGGDDFDNVADVQEGTINTFGCVFIAIGTTPTNWTNGSELTIV